MAPYTFFNVSFSDTILSYLEKYFFIFILNIKRSLKWHHKRHRYWRVKKKKFVAFYLFSKDKKKSFFRGKRRKKCIYKGKIKIRNSQFIFSFCKINEENMYLYNIIFMSCLKIYIFYIFIQKKKKFFLPILWRFFCPSFQWKIICYKF